MHRLHACASIVGQIKTCPSIQLQLFWLPAFLLSFPATPWPLDWSTFYREDAWKFGSRSRITRALCYRYSHVWACWPNSQTHFQKVFQSHSIFFYNTPNAIKQDKRLLIWFYFIFRFKSDEIFVGCKVYGAVWYNFTAVRYRCSSRWVNTLADVRASGTKSIINRRHCFSSTTMAFIDHFNLVHPMAAACAKC